MVSSEQAREAVIREGVAQAEQRTGARAELPEKTCTEVGEPLRAAHGAGGHVRRGSFCAFPRRSSSTPCSCTSVTSRCTTRTAS